MSPDPKISHYIEPSDAQIAARKKRNYAIGGVLFAFCMFVFAMMLIRLSGEG